MSNTIEFHTAALPDPFQDYVIAPAEGQSGGWFPLGGISLVGGAGGTGKTTFMFDLLHKQKQGFPVLGHRTHGYPFHVLDYGGRGEKSHRRDLESMKLLLTDVPTTSLPLGFGTEAVQNIINEIEKLNPIPNIIFIENLDMLVGYGNPQFAVALLLRQLQEVATHFHIALIGSVGAASRMRRSVIERQQLGGCAAWGRTCETVAILKFSDDSGLAPGRELTMIPLNADVEKFSLQFEGGRLVPVQPAEDERPRRDRLQSAIRWLSAALQNGSLPIKTLVKDAHDTANISRTMLYRAAQSLGMVTVRVCGEQCWQLGSTSEPGEVEYEPHTDVDFGE